MSEKILFVPHGHTYQPPRDVRYQELAYLQTDPQEYDWTNRIDAECYQPLARAGVFDQISSDMNPVLFRDLTDRGSPTIDYLRTFGKEGEVGGAWAHVILPFLDDDEKRVLIGAGLKHHLREHHNVHPEVFFAPETALDTKTLQVLADFDYKAFICAPWQLEKTDGHPRSDNIPTRISLPDGRSIIALPYDAKLASKFAFEEKHNADAFVRQHIWEANERAVKGLLFVAADTETFGHWWPYGNMFLEYLAKSALPNHNYQVGHTRQIDYDRLAVPGKFREKSAWSCHCGGLVRWNQGCGCTGGDSRWKRPFYTAHRNLATSIRDLTRRALGKDYVPTLIDNFERGFAHRGQRYTSPEEALIAADVAAYIAETSCGTFHEDPETAGRINYAFALVAMEHARKAGLKKRVQHIESEYFANLQRIPNPKQPGITARDILESMINQRVSLSLAPAFMGIQTSAR